MRGLLLAWGPSVLWAGGLVLLSAWSDPPRLPAAIPHLDKVVHLGLYAVLGATLAWGRHRWAGPATWILLGAGVAFGATDELHQAFVPRREPSGADLVADTAGLVLGYAGTRALLSRLGPGSVPGRVDGPA